MKLTLAGQMVEHVNFPGQVTSLLGLATYSPDYSKGCRLIQGWIPDINANATAANTRVPTRKVVSNVPFQCDIYSMTYGMRNTLQLIRKYNNDALFRIAAAGAGKVVVSNLV